MSAAIPSLTALSSMRPLQKVVRPRSVRLTLEVLEDRTVPTVTSVLIGTTATVTSDVQADTITVTEAGGYLYLQFTGLAGPTDDWDTTQPGIQTLPAKATSIVNFTDLGGGDDVVNLGTASSPASNLLAEFTFATGGSGNDMLNIDDSAAKQANNYKIDDLNSISATITAVGLNISSQAAFFENGITLACSGFNDTIYLTATSGPGKYIIKGNAGNEVLYAKSNALPTTGLTFSGGAGNDTIRFEGDLVNDVVYKFVNAHDGSVTVTDSNNTNKTVNYNGLEFILDTMVKSNISGTITEATQRNFQYNNNRQTITLQDDINQPGGRVAGMSQLTSPNQAVTVFFRNPSSQLKIDGGTGGNTINLFRTIDSAFTTSFTLINSGAANDEVRVLGAPSSKTMIIDTGAGGADKVVVGATSSSPDVFNTGTGSLRNVQGSVFVNSTSGGQLYIDNSGDTAEHKWTFDYNPNPLPDVAEGSVIGDVPNFSVQYSKGFTDILFAGGSGADVLTISGSINGNSIFCCNGGNDTVILNGGSHVIGKISVFGGTEIDTFRLNLSSTDPLPTTATIVLDFVNSKPAPPPPGVSPLRRTALKPTPARPAAKKPTPARSIAPLTVSLRLQG
jgi:acrosin